jgi:VWFA-related protein
MLPVRLIGVAAVALALQQGVFRSGVELVTVDVAVLDRLGDPVADLEAERFEVMVDGSPRRIVSAQFVPHRPAPLAAAPDHRGTASEHFTSNEGIDRGRLVLIAVDQAHIRRVEGLAALRAAANFIDALDPADLIAAAPINHGGPIQFTTAHASVKRYLQTLTGESTFMPVHFTIGLSEALAIADGSRTRLDQVVVRECGQPLGRYENPGRIADANGLRDPCPVQVEQEGRALAQQARTDARLTLDALARLVARLGEIEGPKTLVLLAEGLVAEPQLVDLTSLGAAAQAARVTIHVLQLEVPVLDASSDTVSPTLYADLQLRADGLARLAGSARGGLFRLVGDDPYPFRRILRELSGHYLIAFEAAPADRDGRDHRIQVHVRGDGLMVRARPAFRIPPGRAAAAPDAELVGLLRNPRTATELPLRLASYAFRDPSGDGVHLLVAAEMDLPRGAGEVTAGYVLVDNRGIIAASGGGVTTGGRFHAPASVSPGRYTLKAAAIDGSGRAGSVERRVDAGVAEVGGIAWSDLMLADPPADPGGALRPLVLRAGADRAIAYLEAYSTRDLSGARVKVEIVRHGSESPVAIVPAHISRNAPGRLAITADMPVHDLDAGLYTVSMHVTLPGIPPQTFGRRLFVSR